MQQQHNNNMQQQQKEVIFICEGCQSTESFIDNQGNTCCEYCGILSQQFFAESFDIDDGLIAEKNRSRKLFSHSKSVQRATKKREAENDVLEFLSAYQYCLLLFLRTTLQAAGLINGTIIDDKDQKFFGSYEIVLKDLFFKYLNEWKRCTCLCKCRLSDTFRRAIMERGFGHLRYCDCDRKIKRNRHGSKTNLHCHPQPLSKYLMVAFVYLTCRLQRSAIIPSDMIRWCESGMIPYSALYDVIPSSYKVEAVQLNRAFFSSCWSQSPYFLSPRNMIVMTAGLADSFDLQIPPLNAPLVARSIIDKLGLPDQVWTNYTKLAQLLLPADKGYAIRGAVPLGELYPEYLMAVVVVACKCCRNWTRWSLQKGTSVSEDGDQQEVFSMPVSLAECLSLPRLHLSTLLESIRRVLPSYESRAVSSDKRFAYNHAISHVVDQFGLDVSGYNGDSTSTSSQLSWDHVTAKDSSLRPCSTGLHHSSMIEGRLRGSRELRLFHGLLGSTLFMTPHSLGKVDFSEVCFYLTHARQHNPNEGEAPGGLHHTQYLLLIERCARHLRCPPRLLHILVERLEVQLLGTEGNQNRTSADIHRVSKIPLKVSRPLPTNKTARMYHLYKDFCDEHLSRIRSLGLNGGGIAADELLDKIYLESKPVVVRRRATPQPLQDDGEGELAAEANSGLEEPFTREEGAAQNSSEMQAFGSNFELYNSIFDDIRIHRRIESAGLPLSKSNNNGSSDSDDDDSIQMTSSQYVTDVNNRSDSPNLNTLIYNYEYNYEDLTTSIAAKNKHSMPFNDVDSYYNTNNNDNNNNSNNNTNNNVCGLREPIQIEEFAPAAKNVKKRRASNRPKSDEATVLSSKSTRTRRSRPTTDEDLTTATNKRICKPRDLFSPVKTSQGKNRRADTSSVQSLDEETVATSKGSKQRKKTTTTKKSAKKNNIRKTRKSDDDEEDDIEKDDDGDDDVGFFEATKKEEPSLSSRINSQMLDFFQAVAAISNLSKSNETIV